MTLTNLKKIVLDQLQDSSYSDSGEYSGKIKDLLNECINLLSEELLLNGLFSKDTVTTSTSLGYVDLPDDFHRNLTKCFSAYQEAEVDIIQSFPAFVDKFGYSIEDNSGEGSVSCVCVLQDKLYYQPIPEDADTLTLYYYRVPTDMDGDTDEPDGIPVALQGILLPKYVCKKIYGEMVEDGIEGAKVNSMFFSDEYEKAKSRLITSNAFNNNVKRDSIRA